MNLLRRTHSMIFCISSESFVGDASYIQTSYQRVDEVFHEYGYISLIQ